MSTGAVVPYQTMHDAIIPYARPEYIDMMEHPMAAVPMPFPAGGAVIPYAPPPPMMFSAPWSMPPPNGVSPFDNMLHLGVNIKLRGRDSLLLGQNLRVRVPVHALVRDVWYIALRYERNELHHFDDKLTGRALLIDRYRDYTHDVWMSDPISIVIGSPFDTVVFIAEPSAMDKLSDAFHTGVYQIFDRPSRRYRHSGRRRRPYSRRARVRL